MNKYTCPICKSKDVKKQNLGNEKIYCICNKCNTNWYNQNLTHQNVCSGVKSIIVNNEKFDSDILRDLFVISMQGFYPESRPFKLFCELCFKYVFRVNGDEIDRFFKDNFNRKVFDEMYEIVKFNPKLKKEYEKYFDNKYFDNKLCGKVNE